MIQTNRNKMKISKARVARKMAKKLSVGAMKVASIPIVGHLSYDSRKKFYGEDSKLVDISPIVSGIIPLSSGPILGGYFGYHLDSKEKILGAIMGTILGFVGGLVLTAINESPRIGDPYRGEYNPSLIGCVMEGGIGLVSYTSKSVGNMYTESKNEIIAEEESKLERLANLQSEVAELTRSVNEDLPLYKTSRNSSEFGFEHDSKKLKEVV